MIARTKFQKRVKELSQNHFSEIHKEKDYKYRVQKPVSESHKKWIFKNCLEHLAFATKHKAGCLDCGATFPTSLIRNEKVICPECNTKLQIVHTSKRNHQQSCFVAQAISVEEFQVIRNFYVVAIYKKGKKCKLYIHERIQYWADINGKVQIFGQVPSSFSNGFSGDFECRQDRGGYYSGNKWNVYPDRYLPGSKFRKEFSRSGVSRSKALKNYHFLEVAPILINNPIGETLYKAGQKEWFHIMKENPKLIKSLWPSIKICFRNKYKIKSVRTWIDYVEMLKKYNRDVQNPKYICPDDLHKEHNRYVEKERRLREAERQKQRIKDLAEELKKSAKMEKEYAKAKGKFVGIEFSSEKYNVYFLNSVQDFKEEGDALRHCVFSREYFKEKTLLFSVRNKKGDRVATAELSIKTWRILQVRTMNNVVSPESKAITEMITDNFGVIKDRMKPKPKARKRKQSLAMAS